VTAEVSDAAQSGGEAVLDDAVLELVSRLGGKSAPEFLDRLITMFLESALTLLGELKRALADGDVAALRHASHTLKSCSATIGASLLSERCKELEMMARAGAMQGAAALADAIFHEYQYVQAALITRLAQPTGVKASAG
jgi:HPt (histidine-containing phosphotransfer) domain-containing protein